MSILTNLFYEGSLSITLIFLDQNVSGLITYFKGALVSWFGRMYTIPFDADNTINDTSSRSFFLVNYVI